MNISLSEIKKMVKLANHLDSIGLHSEADVLDKYLTNTINKQADAVSVPDGAEPEPHIPEGASQMTAPGRGGYTGPGADPFITEMMMNQPFQPDTTCTWTAGGGWQYQTSLTSTKIYILDNKGNPKGSKSNTDPVYVKILEEALALPTSAPDGPDEVERKVLKQLLDKAKRSQRPYPATPTPVSTPPARTPLQRGGLTSDEFRYGPSGRPTTDSDLVDYMYAGHPGDAVSGPRPGPR